MNRGVGNVLALIVLAPVLVISLDIVQGIPASISPPPRYAWADPAYDVVHSSIVPCQANILASLRGEGTAETTGEDNLRTVRLVFASYESAQTGKSVVP